MNYSVLAAAISAVVIFGASPVAAKIAVSTVPALDVAILRTVIGGLIAFPVALALKISLPKRADQIGLLLLSGFCGFIGFPILFTLGVAYTSANHASMILAALPVLTGAIAMTWDREKPKTLWWVGCLVALAGEAILITMASGQASSSRDSSIIGDLLVLVANLFAALGYVAGGRLQRSGYSSRGTTFWGVTLFALILLPLFPFLVDFTALEHADVPSWLAIFYLAVGVTIVGYILWYWALGSGGIAKVGVIQFLQPVSGVILAWILLGESLTMIFFLASCIILSGVWLTLYVPSK